MSTLNHVILIGNVAANAESFDSKKGKKVCSFPLAIDRPWPEDSGESLREVDYHRIVAWGKLAEICEKIIHTGAKIIVRGKIINHSYEKDGQRKYSTEIHAEQIEVLKWKNKPEDDLKQMAEKIKKENKKQKAKA
jgi:single-strand DNA-binding protein